MRVGGEFCQVSIFAKLVCQTVGCQIFLFCQNYMDAKLVCQTVRVAQYVVPPFRTCHSEFVFEFQTILYLIKIVRENFENLWR
jgi:hypothetical protein